MTLFSNLLDLYLDAAPWLLLGLLAAGLVKAWLPEPTLSRWLGGSGLWPVAKAAFIGAPLPLCSCGVLPAALALRRGGASKGATVSFLISTPETGPDSIAVSYALLGPLMAVARPVAAVLSAIFAGLLAAASGEAPRLRPTGVATACCCGNGEGGCSAPRPPSGLLDRAASGVRYALTDILRDIAPWLGAGLAAAAIMMTIVPPMALAQWGSGLPAMVVMLAAGIPMYICATASTPVAATMLLAGVSPGTVLVFLLAGPATNLATMEVVRREMGNRVLGAYLMGIAVASITLGLALDGALEHAGVDVAAQALSGARAVPEWLAWASGIALLVFTLRLALPWRARPSLNSVPKTGQSEVAGDSK